MNRISVELVPRNRASLEKEVILIKDSFSSVNMINIPDLLQFELRSWEGTAITRSYFEYSVPHLRARDFSISDKFPLKNFIKENNIPAVLVIRGDISKDLKKEDYPTTSIDLIKKIKDEIPELTIYAALDPYRSGMREELDYAKEKLDAGANGFFTQPFFDRKFMEIYGNALNETKVFWGVSPVCSEKSRNYWEIKNKVVLPRNFKPTLDWNQQFARDAIEFVRERNASIYLMPIKVDLSKYLSGIFD